MHGLSVATQASAGAKTQINADAAKWVDLVGSLTEKAVCVRTAGEVDVRGDAGEALDRAKGLDGPALE